MADLRAGVAYLVRLRIPWTVPELAELASVPVVRAKAYVAQLCSAAPGEPIVDAEGNAKLGVLVRLPDGSLVPGLYARRWLAIEPKTRPGGNSAEYRRRHELRTKLEQRAWEATKVGQLYALTSHTVSKGAKAVHGIAERSIVAGSRTKRVATPTVLTEPMLTLRQAAASLQMSTDTIRRWIHAGYLRAQRCGPSEIRIPQSEVTRALTPVEPGPVKR